MWDVVALSALSAMEQARRSGAASRRRGLEATAVLPQVMERAVMEFWANLEGFAPLGVPKRWWGGVGPGHPFLRVVEGRLVCARPRWGLLDDVAPLEDD